MKQQTQRDMVETLNTKQLSRATCIVALVLYMSSPTSQAVMIHPSCTGNSEKYFLEAVALWVEEHRHVIWGGGVRLASSRDLANYQSARVRKGFKNLTIKCQYKPKDQIMRLAFTETAPNTPNITSNPPAINDYFTFQVNRIDGKEFCIIANAFAHETSHLLGIGVEVPPNGATKAVKDKLNEWHGYKGHGKVYDIGCLEQDLCKAYYARSKILNPTFSKSISKRITLPHIKNPELRPMH